jgi:hypothetical protein
MSIRVRDGSYLHPGKGTCSHCRPKASTRLFVDRVDCPVLASAGAHRESRGSLRRLSTRCGIVQEWTGEKLQCRGGHRSGESVKGPRFVRP